jgi:hypothetical protein
MAKMGREYRKPAAMPPYLARDDEVAFESNGAKKLRRGVRRVGGVLELVNPFQSFLVVYHSILDSPSCLRQPHGDVLAESGGVRNVYDLACRVLVVLHLVVLQCRAASNSSVVVSCPRGRQGW